MQRITIYCSECGEPVQDSLTVSATKPCENCGSTGQTIGLSVSEEVVVKAYDKLRARKKDTARRSKEKVRVEIMAGYEKQHSTGKYVLKERVIDKDNDYYFEKVVDPETGEVIHRNEENLSEHSGHGSAKNRGSTSQKRDTDL